MDMPFLEEIQIGFDNDATTREFETREFSLQLTRRGPSQVRTLTYAVDGSLAGSLECESRDDTGLISTVGVRRAVPLPMLLARRELTGSVTNMVQGLITVAQPTSLRSDVIDVLAVVLIPANN
ncbi:hypothetical protein MTO96_038305 [Rhipicephalus appendiculatus]